jgi:hypothetical protein
VTRPDPDEVARLMARVNELRAEADAALARARAHGIAAGARLDQFRAGLDTMMAQLDCPRCFGLWVDGELVAIGAGSCTCPLRCLVAGCPAPEHGELP